MRGPEASGLRQQDMEYDGKAADKSACIDGKDSWAMWERGDEAESERKGERGGFSALPRRFPYSEAEYGWRNFFLTSTLPYLYYQLLISR